MPTWLADDDHLELCIEQLIDIRLLINDGEQIVHSLHTCNWFGDCLVMYPNAFTYVNTKIADMRQASQARNHDFDICILQKKKSCLTQGWGDVVL